MCVVGVYIADLSDVRIFAELGYCGNVVVVGTSCQAGSVGWINNNSEVQSWISYHVRRIVSTLGLRELIVLAIPATCRYSGFQAQDTEVVLMLQPLE